MAQILRQSTAIDVRLGPFVDVGDAFTPEIGVTIAASDEAEILKANGVATVSMAGVLAAITDCDGWYDYTLSTTDTDVVGTLDIVMQDDDVYLPVFTRFQVVEEAVFDAMYVATAEGPLQGTTAGNTLDVTATGEAGIDLDNAAGTLDAAQFGADFLTSAKIADDAFLAVNFAANSLDGKGDWNVGKTGYSLTQVFPSNFAALSITAGGLINITQAAADKAWLTTTRELTGLPDGQIPKIFSGLTSAIGTNVTLIDASLTQADNDHWKGQWVRFTSGTAANIDQVRLITGFTAASDTLTFAPALNAATASGDGFEIIAAARVDIGQWIGVTPNALIAGAVDCDLSAIQNNVITAASIAASALDDKGNWNVGKTGYSLTQTFPSNFAALSITAGGLVDITQTAANKVWGTGTRELTGLGFVLNNTDAAWVDANERVDVGRWLGGVIPVQTVAGVPEVDVTTHLGGAAPALVGSRYDASVGAMAANVLTATAIAAAAMNGKGDWNINKTGYSISGAITTLDGLNDVAATDIVSAGAINTLAGAVLRVTLTDTTTANVDMRGTNSAFLASSAPTNFSTLSITIAGLVDITQVAANKVWGTGTRTLTAMGFVLANTDVGWVDVNDRIDVGQWLGQVVTLSATTLKPEVDMFSVSDNAAAANAVEDNISNLNAAVTSRATPAQVNTEVSDVIKTDIIPELSQGVLPVNPTLYEATMAQYMKLRNGFHVKASQYDVQNDAGVVIFKKLLTDDGTDYDEAKTVSGP